MHRQTLLEGLQVLPGDGALLQALGSLLEQEADWPELRRVMLEQLPLLPRGAPEEGQVYYLASKACLELVDPHQAVILGSRAVQLQPNFAYGHHILGRALAQVGRSAEALQAQRRCAELAPQFPWCWFEVGLLLRAGSDPVGACSALRRALVLQQSMDPGGTQIFVRALASAEQASHREERQAAARSLWPDRPPLDPEAPLPPLMRLALATEEFRLFLDRRGGAG
jgi:tetratricopeptide (TPR) repeat protein